MTKIPDGVSKKSLFAPPVFIVGMNGSGTTMLADSLGDHPGLYMFPLEAKVIPFFMNNLHRYDNLNSIDACRRLAQDIGRTRSFWQVNNNTPLVVDDSHFHELSFSGVIHAIFGELAQREGKHRWGEKSPMNLLHIATLAKEFPNAQFIHIIRDGREVAQSFHRRWFFHPKRTIYRWKRLVAIGREQGSRLSRERYLEVRFEELTQNPEKEMQRVCNFLNLTFVDKITKSSMRMMDQNQASSYDNRIISNSEKWKEYFNSDQVSTLERIAGRYLSELGYETSIQGDEEPTLLHLCQWFLWDTVFFISTFFRDNGWRGLPVFVRAILASLMQLRANK